MLVIQSLANGCAYLPLRHGGCSNVVAFNLTFAPLPPCARPREALGRCHVQRPSLYPKENLMTDDNGAGILPACRQDLPTPTAERETIRYPMQWRTVGCRSWPPVCPIQDSTGCRYPRRFADAVFRDVGQCRDGDVHVALEQSGQCRPHGRRVGVLRSNRSACACTITAAWHDRFPLIVYQAWAVDRRRGFLERGCLFLLPCTR